MAESEQSSIGEAKQAVKDGVRAVGQTTRETTGAIGHPAWEDRATEWSGIPDKITIKYSVYEVETGKPLASSITAASSKWGTLGGDHPQELLPVPTQQFVDKLF
jgi:hypothetical protein